MEEMENQARALEQVDYHVEEIRSVKKSPPQLFAWKHRLISDVLNTPERSIRLISGGAIQLMRVVGINDRFYDDGGLPRESSGRRF